jgi:hypothetical protein
MLTLRTLGSMVALSVSVALVAISLLSLVLVVADASQRR